MEEALKKLTDICNRASVTIYSFDSRGLVNYFCKCRCDDVEHCAMPMADSMQTRSMQISDNQQGLEILANDTGGRTFFNRNDLTDTISYALEDQKGYYLLAYQPDSESFDAKKLRYNKLEIKLLRKKQDFNCPLPHRILRCERFQHLSKPFRKIRLKKPLTH